MVATAIKTPGIAGSSSIISHTPSTFYIMKRFACAMAALAAAGYVSAEQGAYAQCGGKSWTGMLFASKYISKSGTDIITGGTTCVSGYTCKVVNDYYYQWCVVKFPAGQNLILFYLFSASLERPALLPHRPVLPPLPPQRRLLRPCAVVHVPSSSTLVSTNLLPSLARRISQVFWTKITPGLQPPQST